MVAECRFKFCRGLFEDLRDFVVVLCCSSESLSRSSLLYL